MKEEKNEIVQEFIVLDEGIEMDNVIGPLSVCCFSLLMPIRGN